MPRSRQQDLERLGFLKRHYRQWIVSLAPDEPFQVDRKHIVLHRKRSGDLLIIDDARLSLWGRIRSLRLEKNGRCSILLQGRVDTSPRNLVMSPLEVERLGRNTYLRRQRFEERARRWLAEMFPTAVMRGARSSNSDDAACVRFDLRQPRRRLAVVAVEPESIHRGVHWVLSRGLDWYLKVQSRCQRGIRTSLIFLLPAVYRRDTPRILRLLDPDKIACKVFVFDQDTIEAAPDPELVSGLHDSRSVCWARSGPYPQCVWLDKLHALFPGRFRRFPRAGGGFSLRVAGLEVLRARYDHGMPLYFGPPEFGRRLDENSWDDFVRLMEEVRAIRRPGSRERMHPYYRWQTERWLEEIILCNPKRLDHDIDERFVYSQVPAYQGDQRAILDLLAVHSSGRLVVIELKADRHPDHLVQALDYWDRVHRHNLVNDFEKQGYFEGRALSKEKPLLYLVAPALGFDRRIAQQATLLNSSDEVFRIVVARNWRRKLTVVSKERLP